MGTVLGDLIRIVDNQTLFGQALMNVYYYRVTTVTPQTNDVYEVMLDWFEDNIIANVGALQSDELNHNMLQLVNLSNNIDIVERPIDIDGGQSATSEDTEPSYVTVGYKLVRESLVTRHGYKRFSGIVNGNIDGNTYTADPEYVHDIEEALAADMMSGVATIAEPVIVKHPIPAPPISSYEYSSIGAAQLRGVGTQNTRKPST